MCLLFVSHPCNTTDAYYFLVLVADLGPFVRVNREKERNNYYEIASKVLFFKCRLSYTPPKTYLMSIIKIAAAMQCHSN